MFHDIIINLRFTFVKRYDKLLELPAKKYIGGMI